MVVPRGNYGDFLSESRMVAASPTSNPSSQPLSPSTSHHSTVRIASASRLHETCCLHLIATQGHATPFGTSGKAEAQLAARYGMF